MSAAQSNGPDFPFWSFSTELYGRPGVAPAALALQDRFGCDVNLLLFAIWAARCGVVLGPSEFLRLDEAVGPWRARIVEPIRGLRRALKTEPLGAAPESAGECRRALLAAELAGERAAQELLARTLPMNAPAEAAIDCELARANLKAYLTFRGIQSASAEQYAEPMLSAL
ncbi:MAG TPA: TIGR02444 family protein [Alphaproteobacteria bacterium]|nr:TIGR02444 family protein [Alphaproteobacteria bacterium]